MNTCARYEENIWLAVHGELSAEKQPALEEHIRNCPECSRKASGTAAMLETVRETAPMPELSAWERENISRSILLSLKKEKRGWYKYLTFFRMPSAVLTASLLLLFLGWFGINAWQEPAPVQTASVLKSEEMQIIRNYELISNLELLEEMEHLEKVVETVDRKNFGDLSDREMQPARKADDNEKYV